MEGAFGPLPRARTALSYTAHPAAKGASRRGGVVRMRLDGDRMAIGGQADTTAHTRFSGRPADVT